MTLPRQNNAPWAPRAGAVLSAPVLAQSPQRDPGTAPAVPLPVLVGDAVTVPLIFTSAGSVKILDRPPAGMIRTLLIIQNQLVGNALNISFGRPASANGDSLSIAVNGDITLDYLSSVPQNDIYAFSPVAGTSVLTFIHAQRV